KAELAPRPIGPGPTASRTRFTDAQGRDVAKYAVGDTVYVTVDDADENRTPGVVDTITGALTVENADTGVTITVDLVETGPDSGVFLSKPITTGLAGSGAMLEVAPGQTLNATYQDPDDPTDSSTDNVAIESAELKVEKFVIDPNPMSVTTQFKVVGTGIEKVQVWVYDLSGRLVYDSGQVPGASITWDGGGLANGLYLYIVEAFGRNKTEISPIGKLVILR
ncbi:MAG: T9SS type A sorting domain-containing protein, partial [Candidatus Bipolaricaulia bacterium]